MFTEKIQKSDTCYKNVAVLCMWCVPD